VAAEMKIKGKYEKFEERMDSIGASHPVYASVKGQLDVAPLRPWGLGEDSTPNKQMLPDTRSPFG
jgi:hypothetical protein